MPIYVTGLRELSAAFSKLERETRLGLRAEERAIAEPVRRDAEALAPERLTRIGRWAKMRTGITQSVVYVAPREHGRRGRGFRTERQRRSDQIFAGRLMDWAMEPALHRHEAEIERQIEQVLDHATDTFN